MFNGSIKYVYFQFLSLEIINLIPLLGGNHRGIQGRALLRLPVQVLQRGHAGRPAVPHHIKYGIGHGNLPLVNGVGRGGRGARGVRDGSAKSDRILLSGLWDTCLPAADQVAGGLGHSGRMPTVPDCVQPIRGCLHPIDDGGGTDL